MSRVAAWLSYVLGDQRSRGNLRIVSDVAVLCYSYLASDEAVGSDFCGTGNRGAAYDERVLPDLNVVGDVN